MGAEYRSNPLSLATFDVRTVFESSRTSWLDGELSVDLDQLADRARQVAPALADVAVRIVRPGDSVRVANVLDAIVADVKAADPDTTFPGALGPLSTAGSGRTNRLGGLAVLPVCDFQAAGLTVEAEFPDAYVDMDGPGRTMTAWGERSDLVVVGTPKPDAALGDVDRSIRRAAMSVARDTAAATIGHAADHEESFELNPAVDPELPSRGGHPPGGLGRATGRHLSLWRCSTNHRADPARSPRDPRRGADQRRL